MDYSFQEIEPKWRAKWEEEGIFHVEDFSEKPKLYGPAEFSYPSGAGMHVSYIKAYSSIEVLSRKRRMQGYSVLFPIGFDAFGLPTEDYAIKTNMHPCEITDKNIVKFSKRSKRVGFSFDWTRVIDTFRDDYYKWTQWTFLKPFEKGLVFRNKTLVNYCSFCKAVLSNEDSQGGKCGICCSDVIQLSKDVWYLKITKYADKLLLGLDEVDYPENIKQQQINWTGKLIDAFAEFQLKDLDEKLEIYMARCNTFFGVTFMIIAPEHPLIDKLSSKIQNMDAVLVYREETPRKTEFECTQLAKDKTGVHIGGIMAVNPASGEGAPILTSDYIMTGYSTGATMTVPAHDRRNYEFAKCLGAEITPVIKGGDLEKEAYSDDGVMINSGSLNGMTNKKDSIARMLELFVEKGIGHAGVQFKMKDWALNRQRYWGEPIPLIHCPNCGVVAISYEEPPFRLPGMDNFKSGEDGQSPPVKVESFVSCTCSKRGGVAKRETDIMPQWAGSSWYFLRYYDPHNSEKFADREKTNYWMPADWYNGDMEYVMRHLIYSRFWYHSLYDLGEINTSEPYKRRSAQGMILGTDGEEMGKSKGNVVDPLDIVPQYGTDTLRVYALFTGDYGSTAPWNDSSTKGRRRFLERVFALQDIVVSETVKSLGASLHKTTKKVSANIEEQKYNTTIAALMTFLNEAGKEKKIGRERLLYFVKFLNPLAPHIAEKIYQNQGGEGLLQLTSWLEHDEAKIVDESIEIGVQADGKLRTTVTIPTDCEKNEALVLAKVDEKVQTALEGKNLAKETYVPSKIANLAVKQ